MRSAHANEFTPKPLLPSILDIFLTATGVSAEYTESAKRPHDWKNL